LTGPLFAPLFLFLSLSFSQKKNHFSPNDKIWGTNDISTELSFSLYLFFCVVPRVTIDAVGLGWDWVLGWIGWRARAARLPFTCEMARFPSHAHNENSSVHCSIKSEKYRLAFNLFVLLGGTTYESIQKRACVPRKNRQYIYIYIFLNFRTKLWKEFASTH
jgi:hypothetical protein